MRSGMTIVLVLGMQAWCLAQTTRISMNFESRHFDPALAGAPINGMYIDTSFSPRRYNILAQTGGAWRIHTYDSIGTPLGSSSAWIVGTGQGVSPPSTCLIPGTPTTFPGPDQPVMGVPKGVTQDHTVLATTFFSSLQTTNRVAIRQGFSIGGGLLADYSFIPGLQNVESVAHKYQQSNLFVGTDNFVLEMSQSSGLHINCHTVIFPGQPSSLPYALAFIPWTGTLLMIGSTSIPATATRNQLFEHNLSTGVTLRVADLRTWQIDTATGMDYDPINGELAIAGIRKWSGEGGFWRFSYKPKLTTTDPLYSTQTLPYSVPFATHANLDFLNATPPVAILEWWVSGIDTVDNPPGGIANGFTVASSLPTTACTPFPTCFAAAIPPGLGTGPACGLHTTGGVYAITFSFASQPPMVGNPWAWIYPAPLNMYPNMHFPLPIDTNVFLNAGLFYVDFLSAVLHSSTGLHCSKIARVWM